MKSFIMLLEKKVKSVLNTHKSRDPWFLTEYSVNPYEGCSCNCLYCYIRGSKYGENMSEKSSVKVNALQVLEKQLQNEAKKNQYGFVAVGSATDAYISQEENYRMTQGFLQLLLKYRFPVFISTKRSLIRRDIPILKEIDRSAILPEDLRRSLGRGLILSVSISSMDERVSDMLEPGATPPLQRLELLRELKQHGFLAGVNAIPVLPYISDTDKELEKIIKTAKEYGADYILVGGLTLFGNGIADSKTLYYKFLERLNPDLIVKYNKLYGADDFAHRRYQGVLKKKANVLCAKHQIKNQILNRWI
jgi:DNA repair photolyase